MYDPEEDDPQKQEALDAAKPGKFGATEQDLSRLASMASKGSSAKIPEGKSYSSIVSDSPDARMAEGQSYSSIAPDSPDSALDASNPASLADHHEAQAAASQAEMGPIPKEADDSPSPTIAEAKGKGVPGEFGATASDLAELA